MRAVGQLSGVQEGLKLEEGLKRTDRIEATLQAPAFVTERHPLRHSDALALNLDLTVWNPPITNTPQNPKLAPEKWMKRVLDPYNALVAGIIYRILANPATNVFRCPWLGVYLLAADSVECRPMAGYNLHP